MQKSHIKLAVLTIVIAAVLGAWLSQLISTTKNAAPALQSGTVITPPRPVPAFTLQDAHVHAINQAALSGRWTVMFFGYTSCPDVCPTTLAQLATVHKLLMDLPSGSQPQFVFVSVDPKRDTPEKLSAYLNYFSPDFLGFTGDEQQLNALTRSMGVPVMMQFTQDGAYTIDHSASLFVVNPQLQLTAIFSPPYQATTLANDLRTLVTHR